MQWCTCFVCVHIVLYALFFFGICAKKIKIIIPCVFFSFFFLFSFSSILARIFDKHFVILFYKFFYWGASTNIIINLTLKPHPETLPYPTLTINIYLYSYESVSGLCGSEIYCVFRTLLWRFALQVANSGSTHRLKLCNIL